MNKNKMFIPIIVVLAVVVLAGGYWAWQRWQAQRAAEQILKSWAALGGLSGKDAEEYAKQLQGLGGNAGLGGETTGGGTEEAAQTPEQIYNAAEEVDATNALVLNAKSEIKPILAEIFGGAKLTQYLNNYMGMGEGSGMVQFTLKRMVASGDGNKLTAALTAAGYTIAASGKSEGTTSVTAEKDSKQYNFTFDDETQEISVIVFVTPTTE